MIPYARKGKANRGNEKRLRERRTKTKEEEEEEVGERRGGISVDR